MRMGFQHRLSRISRAFTLIELLVVVSIIGLLLALATPSILSVMGANRLSAAGQNLVGRLSQAQQLAVSGNQPVEVRFYSFTDANQIQNKDAFGAYQFFQVSYSVALGETFAPLGAPYYLEPGVVLSSTTINAQPASKLLTGAGLSGFKDDGSGPGSVPRQIQRAASAGFVAVRVLPDGLVKGVTNSQVSAGGPAGGSVAVLATIGLPDAYMTLVAQKDADGTGTVANYYAVQIDPYTGHVRSYQPGF